MQSNKEFDYRLDTSSEEFKKVDLFHLYPIESLMEKLIEDNPKIEYEEFLMPTYTDRLKELTSGQQMLIQLHNFDGQVKNGGITQFFWNCQSSIFDIGVHLKALEFDIFYTNYIKAVEMLFEKNGSWDHLHSEWSKAPNKVEYFQQASSDVDLKWFDDQYYDFHGEELKGNEKQGLGSKLLIKLHDYIYSNLNLFLSKS